MAVGFKLDYVRSDGDLSNYTPDFFVRTRAPFALNPGTVQTSPSSPSPPQEERAGERRPSSRNRTEAHGQASGETIWIIEAKGRQELDLPQKMSRLKQWCADATAAEENGQRYDFVFVDQNGFEKHAPKTFSALAVSFTEFK